MNVLPISSAKTPFDLATEVLWKHHWKSRAEALRVTIGTLVNGYGHSEATAEMAAIQAFADLDSVNADVSVDVSNSTSSVVVLRQGNGCPVMLTVRDLDRILRQARREDLIKVVDADARRPVVLEMEG